MQIGKREFSFGEGKVYVMGILNVTPDSFSDGGRYQQVDAALSHAEQMVEEGADILDVGGESTRPGYQPISVEEEIQRVTSVIRALKKHIPIPISIDTYKPEVMQAALDAGADLANDIWGLRYDVLHKEGFPVAGKGLTGQKKSLVEIGDKAGQDRNLIFIEEKGARRNPSVAVEGADSLRKNSIKAEDKTGQERLSMAKVIAAYQVPVCLMHNAREIYDGSNSELLQRISLELAESIAIGEEAGIDRGRMILDPGIGFAKSYEQNLYLLGHLKELKAMGLPLLLGASRKSVIGKALELPVEEREEGTIVTSILAGLAGWDFVRVHDVKKNVRALKMFKAIEAI